jgi:hypothetical protein
MPRHWPRPRVRYCAIRRARAALGEAAATRMRGYGWARCHDRLEAELREVARGAN